MNYRAILFAKSRVFSGDVDYTVLPVNIDPKNSPKIHGLLTARMADLLSRRSASSEYEVFWDPHRVNPSIAPLAHPGKIKCFFGSALRRGTELARMDIALAHRDRHDAIALIEIEETGATPKTLLGDALAILIAEGMSFREQPLRVGPWTTLILMGHTTGDRNTAESQARFISQKLEQIRTILLQAPSGVANQCIGEIVVKVFDDENELGEILTETVMAVMARDQNTERNLLG